MEITSEHKGMKYRGKEGWGKKKETLHLSDNVIRLSERKGKIKRKLRKGLAYERQEALRETEILQSKV